MKIYKFFSIILILLLSCQQQKPSTKDKGLAEKIERIENSLMPSFQISGTETPSYNIDERLKELGIPGLSIAVVQNGELEWAKGYGMADSSENRKVTPETMFLAGSISKPVAAVRAHQLVESGKLSLDGNVNDVLTSWKLPENAFTEKEKVTLRRVLNHTAGLTVWGFPGYDKGDTIPTVPDVLDGKGNTDSVRVYKEPGESWQYSGGGYTIMQLMVTDVEGTTFPSTMQKHVLNPIGMTESTFENPLPEAFHSIAATGYRANGDEVEGKWPIYPEMAAAGLWTTPAQLIKYAIEIQRILQTRKDGILKAETVREMLVPGLNGHGLGPGVSEHSFGHGGADEGFRARLIAWKNEPTAVVIMVNSDNGSIIQEVLLALNAEYDLPGVDPDIKHVIEMNEEQLNAYTGTFQLAEMGTLEITMENGQLSLIADFIDNPTHLLPENDTLFFDDSDGTPINFAIVDGQVNGFEVQGLQATRKTK